MQFNKCRTPHRENQTFVKPKELWLRKVTYFRLIFVKYQVLVRLFDYSLKSRKIYSPRRIPNPQNLVFYARVRVRAKSNRLSHQTRFTGPHESTTIIPIAKILFINWWDGQDAHPTRVIFFVGWAEEPVQFIFARCLIQSNLFPVAGVPKK
jgi:hypothetical protein